MKQYFVVGRDGKYLSIDLQSGGYPYFTDSLAQAKIWENIDQIYNYHKIIKPGKTWNIFIVHISHFRNL